MAKKIYVGNLPYSATDEEIGGMFSEYGDVISVRVITDRDTGRSKGFGFVEMSSDEGSLQAINALNGADYHGRPLNVSEARPQESRPSNGGGGGGGRSFNNNRNSYQR